MLAISNVSAFCRNPSISNLFIIPKNPRLLRPVPSMASSKVVAEYAKSGRSSCKKCSKAIAAKALRLGLVSRDARGFDMTKWHHFSCFPLDSKDSVASPDEIKGFSSLTSSDQETLKILIEESACPTEKVADGAEDEGSETKIARSSRVRKTDKGGNDDLEDRNSKKIKLSVNSEGAKLGISFSLSDAKDKYKDATLLPKWKAFQTVIFLEQDEGLHDSGKIAAFDFDGCLVNTSMKSYYYLIYDRAMQLNFIWHSVIFCHIVILLHVCYYGKIFSVLERKVGVLADGPVILVLLPTFILIRIMIFNPVVSHD